MDWCSGSTRGSDLGTTPMLLFFVRHFNDIDHITPIAWKLLESKFPVAVFCMNVRYDFGHDYRIRFLKKRGALVNDLAHEFQKHQGMGSKRMHACMQRCIRMENLMRERQQKRPSRLNRWSTDMARVMGTLCYKLIRRFYYRKKWARRILTDTGAQTICFDHIMPEHYVVDTFLQAARELSIPSVTLPHGVLLYTNEASKAKSSDQRRRQKFSRYDHIVAPNQLRKSVLVKSGVAADKIVVLGSARYCPEWMAQNWEILPKTIDARTDAAEALKLVFFPSKPQCNVDLARLSATVKMLAEIEGIQVMIKPHTRTADHAALSPNPRLYDASNILTAELCGWADAVLVVGSSVITEALNRGKTALYLQYLHANTTLFEELKACWVIRDEAELKRALNTLRQDKGIIPYKEEDVRRYLIEVVQGGSDEKDVLGRYRDFIVDTTRRKIPEVHPDGTGARRRSP